MGYGLRLGLWGLAYGLRVWVLDTGVNMGGLQRAPNVISAGE